LTLRGNFSPTAGAAATAEGRRQLHNIKNLIALNTMKELLLVTLVLSIAGMNLYRRRTDVLTGPYISNRDHQQTIPDKGTDKLNGQQREKDAQATPAGMEFGFR
jgi:hypothetical protein